MTTPNQGPPDGAFTFGGNELHYGQDYNENLVRQMFTVPSPTLTTAIPLMRDALRMAPSGSLSTMKETFGVSTEDTYYVEDVGADGIVDNLDETWWQRIARAIVTGFNAADPDGTPNLADALNSMINQKRETTRIAAGLAKLQADLTGNNNSGETFTVDVSDYAPDFPSVFQIFHESGAGTITNDGDTLEFSNHDGRKLWRYEEPLMTDFFEVSLIVPRNSQSYGGSYHNRNIFWIGRLNEAGTAYCVAKLNGNKLRIGAVIPGVSTIDSPSWFNSVASGGEPGPAEITITPSSYMTFRGGVVGDEKVFQFLVDNRVVATYIDFDDVSLIGEAYRYPGAGIENDSIGFINRVGNVSHFLANDNRPAPVQGSGARISRLSSGSVNVSSGTNTLPEEFFGFTNEKTADIAVNLVNGGFVVTEGDWYTISVRIAVGSGIFPNSLEFCLFRNGLEDIAFGPAFGWQVNAGGGVQKPDSVGAATPIYLNAGDFVQAGTIVGAGAIGALRGESTGLRTHMTIVRGRGAIVSS